MWKTSACLDIYIFILFFHSLDGDTIRLLSRHTQYRRDTKFTLGFSFFKCTVRDFSAGALPIGVKFCTVVRPDLRQVFSHVGGIAPRMAEFWASTGAIWRDMLVAEALVLFCFTR